MPRHPPTLRRRIAAAAFVYVVLASLSLTTAYVQADTAAVWMPSGLSAGLLIALGYRYWPAVAAGAFLVNLSTYLLASKAIAVATAVGAAGAIAAGNTLEALAAAGLTLRFAHGKRFLDRPESLVWFMLLAVLLPPLVSAGIGSTIGSLAGMAASGASFESFVVWYIANAVGILIFAPATVLLLTVEWRRPTRGQAIEIVLLSTCLAFASQTVCGIYVTPEIADWPRAYLLTPLMVWAALRFGRRGALLSILAVAGVAVIGTMRGYAAFPADTPTRSLLYLQLFLAMLTAFTLTIAAALAQVRQLALSLDEKVQARTRHVEDLLRQREMFLVLVAHDLQSPLAAMRNALRAAAAPLRAGRLTGRETLDLIDGIGATCDGLVQRVQALMDEGAASTRDDGATLGMAEIIGRVAAIHQLAMNARGQTLRVAGDLATEVPRPDDVEHVLDVVIDNAIRASPSNAPIRVEVRRDATSVEIRVIDRGPGFRSRLDDAAPAQASPDAGGARRGIGLRLAGDLLARLGGRLAIDPGRSGGDAGQVGACVIVEIPLAGAIEADRAARST